MIKIIGNIAAIIAMALAGYSLATQNFKFMPIMIFSLGVTLLVTGLKELKRKPRAFWGYMNIAASVFMFFVSIQGFFLN